MLAVPTSSPRKILLAIALVAAGGLVGLWAMGYSFEIGPGWVTVVGPATVSPYSAEAHANTPECLGLEERFPKKPSYTREEFEARASAAEACSKAAIKYIQNKERSGRSRQ
jgi:hypothetical protein